MRGHCLSSVLGFAMVALLPSVAHAYVDPGLLGTFYQAIYALVFGVIVSWVIRPWHLVKAWLGKARQSEDDPEARSE